MKSLELKTSTLFYLLFRRGFLGAFTESFNGADVLGVTRKLLTWEFEIKVSKEDLVKELKAIRFLTGADTNFRRARAANKTNKHATYLKHEHGYKEGYFIPNFFSFVVPKEIADYTVRGVAETPYGVFYDSGGTLFSRVTPRKLKNETIDQASLLQLLRKASCENYNLRERLKDLTA